MIIIGTESYRRGIYRGKKVCWYSQYGINRGKGGRQSDTELESRGNREGRENVVEETTNVSMDTAYKQLELKLTAQLVESRPRVL